MTLLTFVIFAATCVFGYPTNLPLEGHGARIIGGFKAKAGQFPYIAELSFTSSGKHQCGGVIINDKWILTAAHCLKKFQASNFQVKVGTTSLNSGGDSYLVDKIVIHRDYNDLTKQNDLGLIRSSTPFIFNRNVQPIYLVHYDLPDTEEVIAAGWGFTQWGSDSQVSNDLQYIQLKTIRRSKCSLQLLGYNVITDNQLCTLTKRGEGVCGGNSGGPLVHENKLVGVVSWGIPCGNGYPDVYTKVSAYLNWIKLNMD